MQKQSNYLAIKLGLTPLCHFRNEIDLNYLCIDISGHAFFKVCLLSLLEKYKGCIFLREADLEIEPFSLNRPYQKRLDSFFIHRSHYKKFFEELDNEAPLSFSNLLKTL